MAQMKIDPMAGWPHSCLRELLCEAGSRTA